MSLVNRICLVAALLMAGLLVACAGNSVQPAASIPRPSAPPLPTLDAQQVLLGARVYRDNCAACHGADGEGQPDWKVPGPDGVYPAPPHDASGHTWHHGDGLLYQIINEGGASLNVPDFKSNMPAFGSTLNDSDIQAVIEYLKSTWPEQERQTQWLASQNDRLPAPGQ
ncbi:MAG: c-type cytochrome [Caldilineae bacterium]|nr:c-type cytochrome [Anaerolineae bacterium]MCB0198927.1 c-type cytochrome [Anaerolineae bacterium]MCB0204290.1 c-type cytochrome [Anaerolineae bacterium]MCB0252311.1 c-type cytochrome [Anaerolineae bacterium]MCB9153841.1 c-type cytochrome [Caldilineae bacterium]